MAASSATVLPGIDPTRRPAIVPRGQPKLTERRKNPTAAALALHAKPQAIPRQEFYPVGRVMSTRKAVKKINGARESWNHPDGSGMNVSPGPAQRRRQGLGAEASLWSGDERDLLGDDLVRTISPSEGNVSTAGPLLFRPDRRPRKNCHRPDLVAERSKPTTRWVHHAALVGFLLG